jgi:hypothetical protein
MRIIKVLAVIALSLSALFAQAPKNVTPYTYVGYETMRDQTIVTNAPYVAKILSIMTKLATDAQSQEILSGYTNFFENPTTDDYHYQSACALLNCAYDEKNDIGIYIIDNIYTVIGTTVIAPPRTKIQLSAADSIRQNAKVLGFKNEVTDSAANQIAKTVSRYEAETKYLAKKEAQKTSATMLATE